MRHASRTIRTLAVVGVFLVPALLAACSSGGDDVAAKAKAGCEQAFSDVRVASTSAALDATVRRCVHWTYWVQTADANPELLGGRDALAVLEERCADPAAGLESYLVCGSLERSTATLRPTPRETVPPIRTPDLTRRPRRDQRARSTPRPAVAAKKSNGGGSRACTPGYDPCIAPGSDVDCYGGRGSGRFTRPGVVYRVTGRDPYRLDSDNDGRGCESQG
jgi:hypothetical protein